MISKRKCDIRLSLHKVYPHECQFVDDTMKCIDLLLLHHKIRITDVPFIIRTQDTRLYKTALRVNSGTSQEFYDETVELLKHDLNFLPIENLLNFNQLYDAASHFKVDKYYRY